MKKLFEKFIEEAASSIVRRTRKTKRTALAGRSAISIAKSKNDPLYKKYKKFRDKFITVKKQIQIKYKSKSNQIARQKL